MFIAREQKYQDIKKIWFKIRHSSKGHAHMKSHSLVFKTKVEFIVLKIWKLSSISYLLQFESLKHNTGSRGIHTYNLDPS